MIRWSAFAFLCLLITINIVKSALLETVEITTNDFNDESFSTIIGKLIQIEQKVNAIEHRLKDMANTETINVERVITQTVKEYEMQRSLDKIALKVEDVSVVQREMKSDFLILNKNLEENIESHWEIPEMQSKNSGINVSLIENLINSYQNQTTIEIATLGKAVITISNVVRELRDSQQKLRPNLESHISNENKKITETIKNQNKEIKNLIEIAQKDMPTVPQHNGIDEYLEKKLMPKLENNFKSINKTLLENRKNLITNQIQINQGFRENVAKYGGLINLIEHEIPKSLSKYMQANKSLLLPESDIRTDLHYINSTMVMLNTSINSITDFLKGDTFEDCPAALKNSRMNGIYKLFMPESGFEPFEADCRLDSKKGIGWTVIQRRVNGTIDFFRNWHDYKKGFGDPFIGEYWIGLEKIHAITSKKRHELFIEMGDFNGNKRTARYSHFEIGNEMERYYLKSVGDYSGDAGDSLGKANTTRKFSTKDADHDVDSSRNCAASFGGAWWYNTCNWSDLNGQYNNTKNGHGINWSKWLGFDYSLKYTLMAIQVP